MKVRYCPECGRSIPLDARICPYCAKTIPMHDDQIVTKTNDDKSKIGLIIALVLLIFIIVTVAIAATVYVYVSGMMGGNVQYEHSISFSKQDLSDYNSLNVIYSYPSDIDWNDLELRVDYNTEDHGMSGTVTVADSINITNIAGTGEYNITIIYIPTNTLIGSWNFIAAT